MAVVELTVRGEHCDNPKRGTFVAVTIGTNLVITLSQKKEIVTHFMIGFVDQWYFRRFRQSLVWIEKQTLCGHLQVRTDELRC